ncbi:MAG: helix-turn-helix domain-containing protein [Paraglaciecola sp.]|nr:helix-turn-helix domain-containing protein [Paraglaciecola sp.]NCT48746.1 helix-turn-helix domain-containing protein [Paraglaciecola sp.]
MKVTDSKTLSVYLRDERKRRGVSQSQVADLVGLRQGTVSRFESSPEKMQLDTLFRLLSALDLELSIKSKGSNTAEYSKDGTDTAKKWSEEW